MPLDRELPIRAARRALLALCVAIPLLAPTGACAPRAAPAAGARVSPSPPNALDVRAFGAKGDGVTDDTAALQAALDAGAGGAVHVPRGTYLVHADGFRDGGQGGLVPRSNTHLHLAPDAVLMAKPTSASDYVVVRIERVSNVVVEGGTIAGERDRHVGSGGEWGYGIGIFGAADVTIRDVTIRDCWGDGIFIQEALPGVSVMSRNVTVQGVRATNNRRQGMSVLGVDGLLVVDSIFEKTNGTLPQAGVDIEPGGYGHSVRNVTFRNCTFRDNAGRGIVADATTGPDIAGLRILGGSATGNGWEGVVFHRITGGAVVAGMTVSGNGATGIYARDASTVTIGGNTVIGNSQQADVGFHGIHTVESRRIVVRDNVVRRGEGARQQRYGVALQDSAGITVEGNDLRESGRLGETFDDRAPRNRLHARPGARAIAAQLELAAAPVVPIDADRAREFVVVATRRAGFAIADPTNPSPGRRIRVTIRNAAGAPLEAVRWGAAYELGRWSSPESGRSRSVDLVFDGARWVEIPAWADAAN